MAPKSTAQGWRDRYRNWRSPAGARDVDGVLDAFARRLDLGALDPDQFIQLLETLRMLGSTGAGVELASLSTDVLVDLVAKASKEQLKAIAEHDELRSVFLDEIFRRMSEHLIAEKVRNIDLVVSWRFTDGDGDGGFDRFQTVIEDGLCVSAADLGRDPDTTITIAADDFMRVATGNANVASMFVTGKVRVKGDYAPAVRLSGYFDIPKPGSPG